MATVDEIAPDIFRINLGAMPGDPITTSFFLIRDEQPTLIETGYRKTFDEGWDAVSRLLDPTTLRYVVVPHFEGDESGALNHFLERAPNAQAVGSPIGAALNLSDFAIREPLAVDDSDAVTDRDESDLPVEAAPRRRARQDRGNGADDVGLSSRQRQGRSWGSGLPARHARERCDRID